MAALAAPRWSLNHKIRMFRKLILAIICACTIIPAQARLPKREFRGAWLHTVYQDQYLRNSTDRNKEYLRNQLDSLRTAGVNAVIFQVRPQADAFYESSLEPWSCYLTRNGAAPSPYWDPLQFMIDECHARGMELHAWLNPYRVTAGAKQQPCASHIYHKHPERFLRYDGKLYFDPALPENRRHIEKVVEDIVERYDVDGIHFDDYFYPYPVKGKEFPDDASYKKYGAGQDRGDWRRANVDKLISGIHDVIARSSRPWVRFGISPFGIWRNESSDPRGSKTSGLQNYDGLYADVLLWARNGWIDYLLPQLYWELDHKAAGYRTLIHWWARNAEGRHMYIGQDVGRTMKKNELDEKLALQRSHPEIQGMCWWPGYSVTRNEGGVADSLAMVHQRSRALVPSYPWIESAGAPAVKGLKLEGETLSWTAPAPQGAASDAVRFVVYRFDEADDCDITDASAIVEVTPRNHFLAVVPGYYVVTALDRVNNESAPSRAVRVK